MCAKNLAQAQPQFLWHRWGGFRLNLREIVTRLVYLHWWESRWFVNTVIQFSERLTVFRWHCVLDTPLMGDGLLRILYCSTDAFNHQFDPKQFKEEMKKQPRLLSSWAVVRYTNSLNTSTSSPIEWMKGLTSLRYETSCLSAGLHQLDPGQLSVSMSARWHYLFQFLMQIIGLGRDFWLGRVSQKLREVHMDVDCCCSETKVKVQHT